MKETLQKLIQQALKEKFDLDIELSEIELERPADDSHGDWSTNIAMKLSKDLEKNPREIAEALTSPSTPLIEGGAEGGRKVEVAGPGFINFYLSDEYFKEQLLEIVKDDNFGSSDKCEDREAIVEYSSPNIAKPFTIGHLRSTIIGDAVANLLEFIGYKVYRDNHLGDWGTQFGKEIYAIKTWGDEEEIENSERPVKKLVELYVKFHKEAERDPEIEDKGREWFKKLEDGDSEAKRLWEKCIDWSWKEFDKIYKLLGVEFTENDGRGYGESFFEDKMDVVIDDLEKSSLLKDSRGAKIIEFKQEKYPPLMIIKKDGATLYSTRDLATDKFRLEKYGKDILIINEVGAEQSLYFKQLFAIEEKLGWIKPEQRYHKAHGLYRLPEGKISTRKGRVIWLEDVLREAIDRAKKIMLESEKEYTEQELEEISKKVGIGALKWNDLKRQSHLDIVFNWDEILSLEGNSSPYIQYSFTRANSILEQADFDTKDLTDLEDALQQDGEKSVLRWLIRFPETVEIATKNYAPNYICEYLYELAQRFNKFYNKYSVLNADTEKDKKARLVLTKATAQVLKRGLNLLGIETVEKM